MGGQGIHCPRGIVSLMRKCVFGSWGFVPVEAPRQISVGLISDKLRLSIPFLAREVNF